MNTETLMRDVGGTLFVGVSRVSLQNIVTARQRGETPEQIRDDFPSLTLAQVYGAILYYLEHQEELDALFTEYQRQLDEADAANRVPQAEFLDTMRSRFDAAQRRHSEQAADNGKAPEV